MKFGVVGNLRSSGKHTKAHGISMPQIIVTMNVRKNIAVDNIGHLLQLVETMGALRLSFSILLLTSDT